jgi:hypothetical protein
MPNGIMYEYGREWITQENQITAVTHQKITLWFLGLQKFQGIKVPLEVGYGTTPV